MKNYRLITILLMLAIPTMLLAQDAKKKKEVIYIQTSAVCDECKITIEAAVKKLKGVKVANLNLTDNKVMVEYAPKKVTPEMIKTAISKQGYDADDMKADPQAYKELPFCCKKNNGNIIMPAEKESR